MTTGRINQVTIVETAADPEGPARRSVEVNDRGDKPPGVEARGGRESAHSPSMPSNCHNRIPQGGVRRRDGPSMWAALRHVRLKRRLPAAVHAPKDGYRCAGMPPSSSEISMANGQSSTDSFGAAPSIIEGAGFRPARVNGRVTVDQQRRAWLLLTGAKPAARHRVEDPANYSNRGGNPFPPLGTARLSQAASPPHASHHTLRNRPEETE